MGGVVHPLTVVAQQNADAVTPAPPARLLCRRRQLQPASPASMRSSARHLRVAASRLGDASMQTIRHASTTAQLSSAQGDDDSTGGRSALAARPLRLCGGLLTPFIARLWHWGPALAAVASPGAGSDGGGGRARPRTRVDLPLAPSLVQLGALLRPTCASSSDWHRSLLC